MKCCSKCGEEKPLSEFYVRSRGGRGHRSECKVCKKTREQQPEVRQKILAYLKAYNKTDRVVGARRRVNLKKIAFTPELFATAIRRQGNRCAICRCEFTGWRTPRCPCADHDHATGAARGVLCMVCNTALGKFADSPELLITAAQYLIDPPLRAA